MVRQPMDRMTHGLRHRSSRYKHCSDVSILRGRPLLRFATSQRFQTPLYSASKKVVALPTWPKSRLFVDLPHTGISEYWNPSLATKQRFP